MTAHGRKIVSGALCGALLLFASRSTPAHHSGVMFDHSSQKQVTGTVSNFEWTNPHVWLWITVVDDKVVVVDPCVGNGRSFPELPMFNGTARKRSV